MGLISFVFGFFSLFLLFPSRNLGKPPSPFPCRWMDGKRVEKNWEKSGGIGHSQIPRAGCKFCWKIEKKLKFLRVLEGKKFPKKNYGKMALDPSVFQHFSALSWIWVGGREGMEFWECVPGISGLHPWNFGNVLHGKPRALEALRNSLFCRN